jgi:hypothetical protein
VGTWGPGNFDSDAALDFSSAEVDGHIRAIEAIFADDQRLRLDEDAEWELMPRLEILSMLCEHCHGILPHQLDIAAWKARYLRMFDDQIDGLAPAGDYKQQRRTIIEATFDKLQRQHGEQWRRSP